VINSPQPCSPVLADTAPRHDLLTHGPRSVLESERCVHCQILALEPLPSQSGVYETTHLRLPHLEPTHSGGRHDPPPGLTASIVGAHYHHPRGDSTRKRGHSPSRLQDRGSHWPLATFLNHRSSDDIASSVAHQGAEDVFAK
jgi:hypothetical protein